MGSPEEWASHPESPHPHVVRVEVKSLPTYKKTEKSEKNGMQVMTISVCTQREADTIMQAALEHRRHQLLAAIRTSLPKGLSNLVGQSPDALLSPPPPPARPAALPPPHQLPQMVASARGEVFWHLPPKRANSHQQTPRRGDATPPWIESPGGGR